VIQDIPDAGGAAVQGSLEKDQLPEILHSLAWSEESGVLQLTQDLTSKHIYLGRGSIVFARSNQHSDRLGELLLRQERLTRAQLADASNKVRASGKKLGAVLVQMGLFSESQVRASVEEQMRSIIHPLFGWSAGEYCFRENANPVTRDLAVELPTIPTILEGTRHVENPEKVRLALGDLGRIVSYSTDPWVHSHQVSLTPHEGFVLSRVDGQSTIADVVAVTPLAEEETLRCLYALISAGFLEFGAKGRKLTPSKPQRVFEIPLLVTSRESAPSKQPEAASAASAEEKRTREEILKKHASLSGCTFYDCLGIRPMVKDPEIRRAYLSLVKKYHPDRHGAEHLRDLQPLLQEILAKATEAYEALYNPSTRRCYDQSLRSEAPRGEAAAAPIEAPLAAPPTPSENVASRYYREATAYLARKEYHEAVKLLEEAVQLDPSRGEYHRALAQALGNNPKWRKEAENHYRAAMKIDPFDKEAVLGLATLYETIGMKHRAKPLFALALDLDPDNHVVRAKLRRS
jgi:curved DNA-binding protein CbpA